MRGYFITGTDTNVGKTYVTCALARRARKLGQRVFAFKPIETGCSPDPDGSLVGSDQKLLATAAGDWQQGPLRGLYRFAMPAAPLVAAQAAGYSVELDVVLETARRGSKEASDQARPGLTLVEGAGGWRVPVTTSADMGDLARALALPVIIVARAGLGTINHSLLTIEAVQRDGQQVAALVLSQRTADDPAFVESNREQIRRRWAGQVLILASDPSRLDALLVAECST